MWNIIYYLFPCLKAEPDKDTIVIDETVFDMYHIYPQQRVQINF
jgi:hypothetical protein